jgi:hypothetical protein
MSAMKRPAPKRRCRRCGCTDEDCSGCIQRTGRPCYWIDVDLCSACVRVPDDVQSGARLHPSHPAIANPTKLLSAAELAALKAEKWALAPKRKQSPSIDRYWTGKDYTTDLSRAITFDNEEQATRWLRVHRHLNALLNPVRVDLKKEENDHANQT